MAILRMSNVFAEAANRLPKEAKAKLPKVFVLLTNDPRHPSLQVKKIEGARRSNIYECRLDQSWRIILQQFGEMTFDLVYVGPHDEAISYGARLREAGPEYSSSETLGQGESILESVRAYLEGDDHILEFSSVTLADLETLATR